MFTVFIENRAEQDIMSIINYYEEQQKGLGDKFEHALNNQFNLLKKNPFFQVRYKSVRCKLVKGFPYLIYYTIDQSTN